MNIDEQSPVVQAAARPRRARKGRRWWAWIARLGVVGGVLAVWLDVYDRGKETVYPAVASDSSAIQGKDQIRGGDSPGQQQQPSGNRVISAPIPRPSSPCPDIDLIVANAKQPFAGCGKMVFDRYRSCSIPPEAFGNGDPNQGIVAECANLFIGAAKTAKAANGI